MKGKCKMSNPKWYLGYQEKYPERDREPMNFTCEIACAQCEHIHEYFNVRWNPGESPRVDISENTLKMLINEGMMGELWELMKRITNAHEWMK